MEKMEESQLSGNLKDSLEGDENESRTIPILLALFLCLGEEFCGGLDGFNLNLIRERLVLIK